MINLQRMLLALCFCASCAHASVITQTKNIPDNTPGSIYDLSFNKFQTWLGPLNSVQIIYTLYIYGGSVLVDNDSELPQTVTANISLQGNLTSIPGNSGVALTNEDGMPSWSTINNVISQTYNLAATTGDDIETVNPTGKADSALFKGPAIEDAAVVIKDDNVSSGFFNRYQGTGTYIITAKTTQTSTATGGGVGYTVKPMQTYGTVTVIYHYTGVPEPATASLAGVGLLLLLRRRRKA